MHQAFFPLDPRQYMLLLTTMTAGGSDATALFAHLPDEERALLAEKAELLKQIPTAKRVPFMVKQMRDELAGMGLKGIEYIDASWLLNVLRGETPRVIASLLVSLPPPLVRKLVERIPPKVRQRLPAKGELEQVDPELLAGVRFAFEQKFDAMPRFMGRAFTFRALIMLERRDLHRLIRILGLEELAQAFIAVGKRALGELCRRLPAKYAEELITVVKHVDHTDLMDVVTAQRFLARVLLQFDDTEQLFQKAGLFRLAKASLLEDEPFHRAFRQRIPRSHGDTYLEYVIKARELAQWEPPVLQRLQDRILLKVKELSVAGRLSGRYATMELALHNPPAPPPAPA